MLEAIIPDTPWGIRGADSMRVISSVMRLRPSGVNSFKSPSTWSGLERSFGNGMGCPQYVHLSKLRGNTAMQIGFKHVRSAIVPGFPRDFLSCAASVHTR